MTTQDVLWIVSSVAFFALCAAYAAACEKLR
jgi:hypothetical protein